VSLALHSYLVNFGVPGNFYFKLVEFTYRVSTSMSLLFQLPKTFPLNFVVVITLELYVLVL
jgi:hypothetical protein